MLDLGARRQVASLLQPLDHLLAREIDVGPVA